MPVAPTATLSERAHATIRRMIVGGELSSGQWLRKRDIADRLSMSPTPVVEAFRRLELEGLVETEPQWGTRVKVFTVAEVFQLAGMRVALESFVARCCAERLTPAQIAAMRPIAVELDRLDAALCDATNSSAARAEAFLEEEAVFHLGLADAAQLPLVRREIERLRVLEATCRLWETPGMSTQYTHTQILDAIASGDPHAAETAMRRHIQDSVDSYIPVLRARFGDGRIEFNDAPGER